MTLPSAAVEPEALDRIRRIGGDELLGKLIGLLVEKGPARWDAVRNAVRNRRWEEVERESHSLQTSVGNLGAGRLMEKLRVLESEARTSKEDPGSSAVGNVEEIEEEFRSFLRFLEEERKRLEP